MIMLQLRLNSINHCWKICYLIKVPQRYIAFLLTHRMLIFSSFNELWHPFCCIFRLSKVSWNSSFVFVCASLLQGCCIGVCFNEIHSVCTCSREALSYWREPRRSPEVLYWNNRRQCNTALSATKHDYCKSSRTSIPAKGCRSLTFFLKASSLTQAIGWDFKDSLSSVNLYMTILLKPNPLVYDCLIMYCALTVNQHGWMNWIHKFDFCFQWSWFVSIFTVLCVICEISNIMWVCSSGRTAFDYV